MCSDTNLVILLIGVYLVCKWLFVGAARNPVGTANFIRGFFR
jgi:hypothetical protein